MPNGILPAEGIADLLAYICTPSGGTAPDWQLRLWVNNLTPTYATVLADLTEATFTGYARKAIARATWGVPTVAAGCATILYGTAPQQWTVGAATTEKVYGYALVDAIAGKLRFVQRLEAADIVAISVGQVLKLQPKITLTSCACP